MNNVEDVVAFEAAIMQMGTRSTMLKAIGKALVTEKLMMAPVARFAARQAPKKVSKAAQQCIVIALPSPRPFLNGSSSPDDD